VSANPRPCLEQVTIFIGPPGTGKTMTVECIAKWTRRLLISLSAADLGTEEVRMEQRLVKWLDRAAMWGAIVLVDEAEVYLEQRQAGDLTRNALVTSKLFLALKLSSEISNEWS
jgi:replication-associated recombination protein RarA